MTTYTLISLQADDDGFIGYTEADDEIIIHQILGDILIDVNGVTEYRLELNKLLSLDDELDADNVKLILEDIGFTFSDDFEFLENSNSDFDEYLDQSEYDEDYEDDY